MPEIKTLKKEKTRTYSACTASDLHSSISILNYSVKLGKTQQKYTTRRKERNSSRVSSRENLCRSLWTTIGHPYFWAPGSRSAPCTESDPSLWPGAGHFYLGDPKLIEGNLNKKCWLGILMRYEPGSPADSMGFGTDSDSYPFLGTCNAKELT